MNLTRGTPDFLLLILTFILMCFGLLMVFSAATPISMIHHQTPFYFAERQLLWAGFGLIILLIFMNIPYPVFLRWMPPLLTAGLLLLILVVMIGIKVNGHRSWFGIGSFGVQPTELVKLSLMLYLAAILSKKGDKIQEWKKGLFPILVIVGLHLGLIMLQPDVGSSIVLALASFIVIIVGGARLRHLLTLVLLLVPVGAFIVFSHKYRVERFTSFLHPWDSPDNQSYQLIQSLFAFAHGGWKGMGIGRGVQKYLYLPEAHTDFIFSVIGEETGFIGCVLFIIGYLSLLWRAIIISLRCPDRFGKLLGIGIVSTIGVQAMINLGGVTGSLPITGIPLPLISYGGSSLLFTLAGMGMLLTVSRYRDHR